MSRRALLLSFFAIVVSLLGFSTKEVKAIDNCTPNLAFGSFVACTISGPGEVDTFTFTGAANDVALFQVSRISGALNPEVEIYSPNSSLACKTFGNVMARHFSCSLPFAGTYTMRVFDAYGQTDTGDYQLFLQRNTNPGNATNINYGETLQGAIDPAREIDTFTFNGTANDKIFIRITRTSGLLDPEFFAFNPQGQLLCRSWGSIAADSGICNLPYDGLYTIIIFEALEQGDTGNYNIYVQRLNDPGNSPVISFGETLPGSISYGGERDTFKFDAKANDNVGIRMARTTGTIAPEIFLYDSNANVVCRTFGNQVAEISSCTLPADGRYTILAFEAYGNFNTGNYTMSLSCRSENCGIPNWVDCEKSPTTGLDGCLLKPGDMLFVRGRGTFESLIKLGSWWSHVALYIGNGRIIQAIPYDNDVRDIEELDIKQSDWWRSDANTYVQDWLVLRPKTSDEIKGKAIADAKRWAGPPELLYETPILASRGDYNSLNDETRFYCSKLVWRAYYRNGYDLDVTRWEAFGLYEKTVTPGDLDNSQSTVVQRKSVGFLRGIFLASPLGLSPNGISTIRPQSIPSQTPNAVHIMVVDPQGRRTGFDPNTKTVVNEIPNAVYEGYNTLLESVSVEGAEGSWKVVVTSDSSREYQLGAELGDTLAPRQQRLVGQVFAGTVQNYTVNMSPSGDVVLIPQYTLHLPLIRR